jgi:hypothetical protein
MPSIDQEFLKKLKCDYTDYKTFVETGTWFGETIFEMEPLFDNLYTIELSQPHYTHTKSRYRGNKINFILGDSSTELPKLLPMIEEKTIFFLDGHWSCDDTAKGNKEVPLYEELQAIYDWFTHEAVVIIDDVRLFSTNRDVDWSQITKDGVLARLGDRIKEVYYLDSSWAKNDRMIVHIGPCKN